MLVPNSDAVVVEGPQPMEGNVMVVIVGEEVYWMSV